MADDTSELSGTHENVPRYWVYCVRCWCRVPLVVAFVTHVGNEQVWLCPECGEAAGELDSRWQRPTEGAGS